MPRSHERRAAEIYDFEHDSCELLVLCSDADEAPIAEATVRLDGPASRELPTDPNGQAWFKSLLPGSYKLEVEKKGYKAQQRTVQVNRGGVGSDENAKSAPSTKSFAGTDGGGTKTKRNPPVKVQLDKLLARVKVGVVLYQFPGVTADIKKDDSDAVRQQKQKKAAEQSRALQVKYLQDCVAWNEKLNRGESVPSNPPVVGQPITVPGGDPAAR